MFEHCCMFLYAILMHSCNTVLKVWISVISKILWYRLTQKGDSVFSVIAPRLCLPNKLKSATFATGFNYSLQFKPFFSFCMWFLNGVLLVLYDCLFVSLMFLGYSLCWDAWKLISSIIKYSLIIFIDTLTVKHFGCVCALLLTFTYWITSVLPRTPTSILAWTFQYSAF